MPETKKEKKCHSAPISLFSLLLCFVSFVFTHHCMSLSLFVSPCSFSSFPFVSCSLFPSLFVVWAKTLPFLFFSFLFFSLFVHIQRTVFFAPVLFSKQKKRKEKKRKEKKRYALRKKRDSFQRRKGVMFLREWKRNATAEKNNKRSLSFVALSCERKLFLSLLFLRFSLVFFFVRFFSFFCWE